MMSRWRIPFGIALLACALGGLVSPAFGATNAVTAGIRGLDNGTIQGGDGTGTGRIDLVSVTLALQKQARDLDGSVVPDGTDVTPGRELFFVLFVDNTTDIVATDVRLSDPIDDSQFTYVTGTLEETTVTSGADDATIWSGVWTPLTDALGVPDDAGSVIDTGGAPGPDRVTIGAESGQANQSVDITAGSLRAIRFRVVVN